ncbi:twin-arginine translocation signal domain-containing protein [bacterium]|nr:twin-arginine translocation signal domain-containing protein [bacterium]
MSSRRSFLKLVGGGAVAAAATGAGLVALKGPSESARAPWREAGRPEEYRRKALSWAILAPNPHNRQPWLVELEGRNALTLRVDLERRLPETDPFDRQITIGCGAFLEILALAAARDGYRAEVEAFPEGQDMATLDRRPVARVRFVEGEGTPDPLFAFVLDRRSNKDVYDSRDVPSDALARLAQAGRGFGVSASTVGNDAVAAKLRDLTWRAHVAEVTTPRTLQESIDLTRIGAAEVAANPDGIALEGPAIEAGRLLGLVSREKLADPGSVVFRQGLDLYREKAMSARAFGWLSNENRSRTDQIDAGRAYARVNLEAARLGLGIHPWSQSLQEYDEMRELHREVHDLVGRGKRVQMLFRIGHAPNVGPAPRRRLEHHLA